MEQKRKPHGFAITPGTLKRVRVAAAERDVDMGELAEAALIAYLDNRLSAPYCYGDANVEQHDLLEFVLENGSSDDRNWITGGLKILVEAIRSRSRQRRNKQ